jgi:hypothetical protein
LLKFSRFFRRILAGEDSSIYEDNGISFDHRYIVCDMYNNRGVSHLFKNNPKKESDLVMRRANVPMLRLLVFIRP